MHWLHDSLGFEPSTKLFTGCSVNHSVIGIATETHSGEGSRLCALCVRAPLSNVELHVRVGEILERTTKYRPNQAFSSPAEDCDWSIDTEEGVWSPTPSFEHGRRLRTDFASLQDTSRGQAGRLVYILSLRNSPFSPEQLFITYYISEQFYLIPHLKKQTHSGFDQLPTSKHGCTRSRKLQTNASHPHIYIRFTKFGGFQ